MTLTFSIAIPTYNRARLLHGTLLSLRELVIPPGAEVEIIVIDNNCTDDTRQVVEEIASSSPVPLRCVLETRQGLGFGRNRAIDEAKYDHIIYLDDDIEINPKWLFGYLEALQTLNADCVVGPVSPKFEKALPAYMTPRIIDSVSSPYSQKGDSMILLPDSCAHEVPGCNFGVRKAVAVEVKGFDTSLGRVGKSLLAGEDFEFGQRLVRAGKRVVYHPECSIRHVITEEKLSKSYLRRRWYGFGATQRALEHTTKKSRGRRRIRAFVGATRLAVRAALSRLTKPAPVAFEHELEAWRAWGYIFGLRS
jgi:glycosyltransferase involved in cell wall biosynthesis